VLLEGVCVSLTAVSDEGRTGWRRMTTEMTTGVAVAMIKLGV